MRENSFVLYDKCGNFMGIMDSRDVNDLAKQGIKLVDGPGSYEQAQPFFCELEKRWFEFEHGSNYIDMIHDAQDSKQHNPDNVRRWNAFCEDSKKYENGRKV